MIKVQRKTWNYESMWKYTSNRIVRITVCGYIQAIVRKNCNGEDKIKVTWMYVLNVNSLERKK